MTNNVVKMRDDQPKELKVVGHIKVFEDGTVQTMVSEKIRTMDGLNALKRIFHKNIDRIRLPR